MQKIFPESLQVSLSKGLQPFYILAGQDLLLINETKDQIIQKARAEQFDEKVEFTINNETKWEELFESIQAIGLFFPRQILLVNLPDSLTSQQQEQLSQLIALSHSDILFIFHIAKFSKNIEKQAWVKQLENQSLLINCQTPDFAHLPQWLQQRAKLMSLKIEPEAVQLLCYNYEGNLLALKQILQLLQLQYLDGKITLSRVQEIVEQETQFTAFHWADALLEGKITRAIRILNRLKAEDTQAVILLRVIQKELFILLEITRSHQAVNNDQPLPTNLLAKEFERLKIWQNRRKFYQAAISRLTYKKLYLLIQSLAQLEKKIKQEFSEDIWLELENYCTLFL